MAKFIKLRFGVDLYAGCSFHVRIMIHLVKFK